MSKKQDLGFDFPDDDYEQDATFEEEVDAINTNKQHETTDQTSESIPYEEYASTLQEQEQNESPSLIKTMAEGESTRIARVLTQN